MGVISRRNEITIPAEVMAEAGLVPGDHILVRSMGPGRIELITRDDLIDEYAGSFDSTVYPPGYLDETR
jgi:bifunctional DNA-binding transcriptional regulator/antitoxin component of YhaV-PrlF toxin-antitoxin module